VPIALERFEKRCRRAVERGQTTSRRLARAMFVRRRGLAWARDQLAGHIPPNEHWPTSSRPRVSPCDARRSGASASLAAAAARETRHRHLPLLRERRSAGRDRQAP
jgi:hypothetical protein